jgi:uncharacterized protein
MATNLTTAILQNSRLSHLFRRADAVCLYHSLTLRTFYGGQLLADLHDAFRQPLCCDAAVEQLSSYPASIVWRAIEELHEAKLLVPTSEMDASVYIELFQHGISQYAIQHMYFISTTGCNLRCRYCFVEADDRPFRPNYMTRDTARKGLEIFAGLTENAPRVTMTFYGGEPLLNAEVVYYAMRYVRELESRGSFSKNVSMTLLTNGVLVDDKTVEVLRETGAKVSVSIDGPEELHDACRQDAKKQGSFQDALRGFRLLQQTGLDPGVSCTLSSQNVERIEDIARFIISELRPSGMGFNVLLPTITGGNPVGASHDYAARQLVRAFVILRENGIYEDRVMRRVRPFTEKRFHFKDCMGVGGQLVLSPDGRIGPCQAYLGMREKFQWRVDDLYGRLKTLKSDDIYGEPMFDEWRHRFPLNMSACTDCPAIGICGGGCPYAAEVVLGSIWEVDERVCSQCKQVLDWMIWDTYEHASQRPERDSDLQTARI